MNKPPEYYLDQITKELSIARLSRTQGNEGRVRVCSRRAASLAILWRYDFQNQLIKEQQAIEHLQKFGSDNTVTQPVSDAATRLASRITPDFKYAYKTDPIEDALIVIDFVKKETGNV